MRRAPVLKQMHSSDRANDGRAVRPARHDRVHANSAAGRHARITVAWRRAASGAQRVRRLQPARRSNRRKRRARLAAAVAPRDDVTVRLTMPVAFGRADLGIDFWKAPDNRHEEGNERVLHRRPSKSRWPRPCVGDPRGRSEALDRGARRPDIEPRNDVCPGCRRGQKRRKATPPVALSRVVGGPRGVGEPVHACDLFMLRTGRSRGRPLPVDDAPSWMVRGVACRRAAGREGNAKAVILR